MEKAFIFLPDWLAVGAAVFVFLGIGLLVGKWIWGRHGIRLAQAVDENMNLLTRWSDLGETQRVLFKKLRTRWQSDRDTWDEEKNEWTDQLSRKEKIVGKLIAEIKRLKEEVPKTVSDTKDESEEIEALKKQIQGMENELQDALAEMDGVRSGYIAKASLVKSQDAGLAGRSESDEVEEDLVAANLQMSVLLRQRSRETLQMRKTFQSRVAELPDALEEKEEMPETVVSLPVEILEVPNIDLERGSMAREVEISDLNDELEDVRLGYHSKIKEIADLKGQAEELESIIEDRNQEVEDAGKELKLQLNTISNLRSSIAELKGEVDGQDVESVDLAAELVEKNEQAAFLTERISLLEEAVTDRYAEVNKVRAKWTQLDKRAEDFSDQAETLARDLENRDSEVQELTSELDEKVSELKPLNELLKEVDVQLERSEKDTIAARKELEDKELSLAVAEEGAIDLRSSLVERTGEFEEAISELSALKLELEESGQVSQERKVELEEAISRLDEYDQNLAQREESIAGMEETVDRIEAEADSLKILLEEGKRNTADLESRIAEFEDLVQSKNSEIGVFTSEIRNLVESVDGPEPDGGDGSRGEQIERLFEADSTDSSGGSSEIHIRILSDTVTDLQNRLVEAEGNYGACERERALMHEQTDGIREKFDLDLMTRDKQILILKEEIFSQQSKLEDLRKNLEPAEIESSEKVRDDDVIAVDDIRGVRGTTPVIQPAEEHEQFSEATELNVNFEEKSYDLKSSEMVKIDEVAQAVRKLGLPFRVSVDGFSGDEGSEDFNELISARRADAVRERLIEVGVAQSLITISGKGEHGLYTETANVWKARRVEIQFVMEAAVEVVT